MDSLRVLGPNRVAWLNVTGSGNETAAHVQENPRMTLMFTAFQDNPTILRLYGTAKAIHKDDAEWQLLFPLFKPLPGARQIFDLSIDLVQTSCGMAVPLYDYIGEREQLNAWAAKKGEEGVETYWKETNHTSLDGKPTRFYTMRKAYAFKLQSQTNVIKLGNMIDDMWGIHLHIMLLARRYRRMFGKDILRS